MKKEIVSRLSDMADKVADRLHDGDAEQVAEAASCRSPSLSIAIVPDRGRSSRSPCAAQQPRIDQRADDSSGSAGRRSLQSFRSLVSAQPDVAWIGYTVPVVDGERMMCCFNSGNELGQRQRRHVGRSRLLRRVPARAGRRRHPMSTRPQATGTGDREARGLRTG